MKITFAICNHKKVVLLSLSSLLLASCAEIQSFMQDDKENKPIVQNTSTPTYYFDKKQSVSLQDAAQMIVAFHPRIYQAKGDENTEAEMINIAEAAYYPQISGGLGLQRENDRSARYDKKYIQDMSVSINQVLYDFGKISNAVKIAEYGHLGAQLRTKLTNEELIRISSSAVITANRSKELSQLAKAQVESVNSLSKLVEERHAKGASNLSDVYQAKSRVNDVMSEELDVNSQHQSIIKSLGVMIGQRHIQDATVGQLPVTLESACYAQPTWSKIPEYELAQIEAERAVAELERAKADELPTISLAGNASRPLNATPRYGSRVDTKVGINVTVPVYQGGALSAGKKLPKVESIPQMRDKWK